MFNHRKILKNIAVGSLASTTLLANVSHANTDNKSNQHPNIIFILTDDQGYGDFSTFGNSYLNTPAMDSLRRDGVYFSNFHVSAVCAPTRAAFMSGRFHYRTGVSGVNKSKVNMCADEKTIAEYLKEAGYDTGLFGKWHLGYNYPMRATDQGFDVAYMWDEMQITRTDPVMEELTPKSEKLVQYKKRFLTDVVFDHAIDYIEEKSKTKKPFFSYIATFLPHTHPDGTQVPEKYSKKFDKYSELNWHTKQCYGMIEKVDEQMERLLKKLDDLGIADNTMIIFATDNGPASGYHTSGKFINQDRYRCGFKGMKGTPYEGGIRVPLFIKYPKNKFFTPGKEIKKVTAHVDLLPTVMDILNIPLSNHKKLDGRTLYPMIKGDKDYMDNWKNYYFYSLWMPDMKLKENMWQKSAFIDGKYKLVNGNEVYEIEADPYEQNNLAVKDKKLLNKLRTAYVNKFNEIFNERKTHRQPNILGSGKQDVTTLYYFEKIPRCSGWPVKVIKDTNYKFTIAGLQLKEIEKGAKVIIKSPTKKWVKEIDFNNDSLVIDNVKLPMGEYELIVYVEGFKKPQRNRKWTLTQGRYHAGEFGHRRISVEEQK